MKTKILIVDDYRENVEALSQLIASENVETYSAMNADEALELVSSHDFGLALLDVQMPGTSGFELAKIIRSVKRFRSLPIIFVTAHQQDSSVIFEGYKNGAVDVLFKPLDANMVRAKVQMFVELAQQKELLQTHVRELERLRIEAEAANIAKSQFLANMSHEIRTPLAAVMGFSELIAKGQVSNTDKGELVAAIERNGNLLLRLIDDILDLSKIEANKLEFERVEFNLAELLRDINSTLSFRASEKGLALEFIYPEDTESKYVSDSTRIKQVLLNIIGNAIKFTSVGTVRVQARISKVSRKDGVTEQFDHLIVEVTDQGVGLTKDQAERLFEPFRQADPSTRRQFGGSGLGLVISRQISRALGGDIKLKSSVPGKGSTFVIDLMLERLGSENQVAKAKPTQQLAPTQEASVLDLAGRKILAVDDSPDNLTLISLFLQDTHADITYVESGLKAINQVRTENFDLILMDVQMPVMDGHETTEEIRRLGYSGPIIALTAHAIKSEHDRCRRAGCNEVLTKPVNRLALLETMKAFLDSSHLDHESFRPNTGSQDAGNSHPS